MAVECKDYKAKFCKIQENLVINLGEVTIQFPQSRHKDSAVILLLNIENLEMQSGLVVRAYAFAVTAVHYAV